MTDTIHDGILLIICSTLNTMLLTAHTVVGAKHLGRTSHRPSMQRLLLAGFRFRNAVRHL